MYGVGGEVMIPETDARSPNSVRESRLAALQGMCGFVPLLPVETQPDHSQCTPGRVALDGAAVLLDPYPGTVTIAEPILDIVGRSKPFEMPGPHLPVSRQIIRMYSRRPQLLVPDARERRKLRVLAPVVDPSQPVIHRVPVPKADLGAP
jgi:hypothetical protein